MELKDCRILIVDDHLLLRQIATETLKGLGVSSIDWVANGVAGLEKIRSAAGGGKPYHIVLLDWSMPEMNGYDLLLACRGDKGLNSMAIVMLTAESEDINIVKALEAGATAYITKPFKPETLVKKLEEVTKWQETASRAG